MLEGKDILVVGARAGGYGAAIAQAALDAGARVFGTTLDPTDVREQEFFRGLGATLLEVPLKYDAERRDAVFEQLAGIEGRLEELGVSRLHAVIHAVAGGFPRQPSVMKAVGDVLKGKQDFSDLSTGVKRNVYYVNAQSFEDTVRGLYGITDGETHFMALTYRGDLPYFISPTKAYLEKRAVRLAEHGKRTIIGALPEAWTQSSQFFTGIEIAVVYHYLRDLQDRTDLSEELVPAFSALKSSLADMEGVDAAMEEVKRFITAKWTDITSSDNQKVLFESVNELFGKMRKEGTFPALRRSVEAISDYVREAAGKRVIKDLIAEGRYNPGEVKQIFFKDLTGVTPIGDAGPRETVVRPPSGRQGWVVFEKDDIRKTLSMYGDSFLFLDRVVMETGEVREGAMGFGSFTVPTPEENPIMKDHFVGMPLFGGHLQMEAVAQFGTFLILKALKDKNLVPILTGTEFPDLNTMAPPGEKLSMRGIIHFSGKRNLVMEAFIENRYARSKGVLRGMFLNPRLVKKMMSSF